MNNVRAVWGNQTFCHNRYGIQRDLFYWPWNGTCAKMVVIWATLQDGHTDSEPPVGGIPYSSFNVIMWSMPVASSSILLAFACGSNRPVTFDSAQWANIFFGHDERARWRKVFWVFLARGDAATGSRRQRLAESRFLRQILQRKWCVQLQYNIFGLLF